MTNEVKDVQDVDHVKEENGGKVHPWRLCPIGKHYVKEHQEHIPPSKTHPGGEVVIRHAHCASNPLGKNKKEVKDILSFGEIQIISNAHFADLPGPPAANVLEFDRADEFDHCIRGWVKYWNKVFEAKNPLDPNLVKALIASESGFDPKVINDKNSRKIGSARGLMQNPEHKMPTFRSFYKKFQG